jgi:hypothetical protein
MVKGTCFLFRRFHLKYEKEQNGTFKLSLASDEGPHRLQMRFVHRKRALNAVAYARYETTGEEEKTQLRAEANVYHRRSMMGGSYSRTHSANGNMVRRKTLRGGFRLSTKGSQSMAI